MSNDAGESDALWMEGERGGGKTALKDALERARGSSVGDEILRRAFELSDNIIVEGRTPAERRQSVEATHNELQLAGALVSVLKVPDEENTSWDTFLSGLACLAEGGTLLFEGANKLPCGFLLNVAFFIDERDERKRATDTDPPAKIVMAADAGAVLPDQLRSRCVYVSLNADA